MAKIKILCTSTGAIQFAPERYKKYNIGIVDIHFIFKGVEYLESEMEPEKFYAELEALEDPKKNLPKTAMPTMAEIHAHFDKAVEQGYDTIIAYTISTGLGGTYNAFLNAVKEYDKKIDIHVVNTKIAAFSEGIHAIRAAQMVEDGYTVEEILKESEWAIKNQEFFGIDGKLDYLIYNGRLKGAKAFMGQVLKICPVLHFNRDGEIEPVESVRTQKKALIRLCEKMKEIIGDRDTKDYLLFRIYTGAAMIDLLKEAEAKTGLAPNHENVVMTPVSGCHNGPWLAAYGFYKIRREDESL